MLSWLWLSGLVIVLDQATKTFFASSFEVGERVEVLPFFSWILVYNEGAAFSFLSDAGGWQRWFFLIVALGVSLWILRELYLMPKKQVFLAVVYALILGGAIGNSIDRLLYGAVVDFILLYWRDHYFPAFNLADSAITLGVIVWIALIFLSRERQRIHTDHT